MKYFVIFLITVGFGLSLLLSYIDWGFYGQCLEEGLIPSITDANRSCTKFTILDAFGIGAPPPERVPLSSNGIYDLEGNRLDLVNVGEQIQIQAVLANGQDMEQSLAYIVEVYDEIENQVYRSWIDATLGPNESFSPAVSWIPEKPGYYTTKIMVWEALDNPSSLSPPLESEFYVVGDISALNENRSCNEGKELVFKINYKKVACVFPETLVKLLGRGWANWHDWYSPLFIDNLRQGPQDVDEVHAEFVKREVMKDSDVAKHFLRAKNYDYTCCTYLYNENDYPLSYQLVINFSDLPNEKQLVVVYDLRQTKVVDTELKDMVQLGGPIITEPEPESIFETPDDFNFVYSFGIDEKNLFDSKRDLYVADMVCYPSIEIDVSLSKEEKQTIWQSITENQFFDLDDFTETCDAFGNCRSVEPEQKITLSITANGKNHSIHFREAYFGNDKNLAKFNNIIETIQEILDQKDEIKNLPTPKCAYL